MGLILDLGALIAFDRGDRDVAALVEATRRKGGRVVTSSGAVAETWRGGGSRQALLARLLHGVDEHALDPGVSRTVGALCGQAGVNDVVDAHVVLLARDGDLVLTSDVDHLRKLLRTTRARATVGRS